MKYVRLTKKEKLIATTTKGPVYSNIPERDELYNRLAELEDKIEDSVVLSREEYERLVKTAQGKIGNMKSTDFLKACISSGVMVEAVSTEEQVKQAYEKGCKETAEKFLDYLELSGIDTALFNIKIKRI